MATTKQQQELVAKLTKLANDMEIVVERRKALIEKAGRAFDAAVRPETPDQIYARRRQELREGRR